MDSDSSEDENDKSRSHDTSHPDDKDLRLDNGIHACVLGVSSIGLQHTQSNHFSIYQTKSL